MRKQTKSNVININKMVERARQVSRIRTFEALLGRAQLAASLGYQYGTDRDIYTALGYLTTPGFQDYAIRYERQDIAQAVIDRPVEATWRGAFTVQESDETDETVLEKSWEDLDRRLHFKQMFMRLDKLSSLGKYGILFLGFNDVSSQFALEQPVKPGKGRQLLYCKPLTEGSAMVVGWERDTSSPRYSMPTLYDVTLKNPGPGDATSVMRVHWTRTIHVPGRMLESETDGLPELKVILNRLFDLEKLVGGSAEMFWRGARPGYTGKIDDNAELSDDDEKDMQDQIDEYEHKLRRILIMRGVELKSLDMQIADPKNHIDAQLQMICAVKGIPMRVLLGTERGQLASSEDQDTWLTLIKDRRENFAELQVIRPFVDRLLEFGVLPPPKDVYSVVWTDLYTVSDETKTKIGQNRATALGQYTANPEAQVIFPPKAFLRNCMGLDEDEIDLVTEEYEDAQAEQEAELEEEARLAEEARKQQAQNPPPPPSNSVDAVARGENPAGGEIPPQPTVHDRKRKNKK